MTGGWSIYGSHRYLRKQALPIPICIRHQSAPLQTSGIGHQSTLVPSLASRWGSACREGYEQNALACAEELLVEARCTRTPRALAPLGPTVSPPRLNCRRFADYRKHRRNSAPPRAQLESMRTCARFGSSVCELKIDPLLRQNVPRVCRALGVCNSRFLPRHTPARAVGVPTVTEAPTHVFL